MLDGYPSTDAATTWLPSTDKNLIWAAMDFIAPTCLNATTIERAIATNLALVRTVGPSDQVIGVSIPIEHRSGRPDLSLWNDHKCFELVSLLDCSENQVAWFQSYVLPRQVSMLQRVFGAQIFTCCREPVIAAQLLLHGWRQGEPDFELILEREEIGLHYDCSARFFFAP